LPDYKGLRGDPSDNIIGIKGIGEKTATLLIQKFGTIENIYKTLKADKEIFKKAGFSIHDTKRFETYQFLSKVIHPLTVAPEEPQFLAGFNRAAMDIARNL